MPRPADLDNRSAGPPALRWQDVAWFALLIVAVWWVYGQTRHHDFVRFDDFEYIVDNPLVNGGLTLQGLSWAFFSFHSNNWHPLTWLSHMADVELFGLDAGGHHFVGFAIHLLNSGLLFHALRKLTGAARPSWVVAALFALHPLRIESVAWASERKDLLAGLFFMLILIAYARYARQPNAPRYMLVAAALVAGLMCKPMLVSVPLILLLLDFWPLRRPGLEDRLYEKLPLFVLAAASVTITWLGQRSGGAVETLSGLSLPVRAANALVAYVGYLWKTIWPANLAFYYPHPALAYPDVLARLALPASASALLLVAVSLVALAARKRRPYLIAGWAWFVVMLLPVIGLLQVGNQAMADRYAYLPLIGVYIALVWTVRELVGGRVGLQRVTLALLLVILAGFAVVSRRQAATWRDSSTLFRHALRVSERNYVAHFSLGDVYRRRGELERAAREYERALSIRPDFVEAHNNYGVVLADAGRHGDAVEHYRSALRLRPTHVSSQLGLGLSLLALGDRPRARQAFQRALELDPTLERARAELTALEDGS